MKILALAAAVMAVSCVVGTSAAAPQAPPDPNQRVVSQGVTDYPSAQFSRGRAGERCSRATAERWGKNIFGLKVIRFFQTVKWCWNRSRITYIKRRKPWGTTPAPGWDYKGATREVERSRVPGRWTRLIGRGKFALCGSFGCLQNKQLSLYQTVFRGGGYRSRGEG